MESLTIEADVDFSNNSRKRNAVPPATNDLPGRIPRITRMMALAIRIDMLIRDGAIVDYADVARLGHVSRARVTQIMSLMRLAPDIQEAILFLEEVKEGSDPMSERMIRSISERMDWSEQRKIWRRLAN